VCLYVLLSSKYDTISRSKSLDRERGRGPSKSDIEHSIAHTTFEKFFFSHGKNFPVKPECFPFHRGFHGTYTKIVENY
jgi:hypothetical protein